MLPIVEITNLGLLPTQYEFMIAPEKEVLLVGGRGSSKSFALCVKLIQQASIPGNVCLLTRKHLTHLKISTLRLLLEDEGTRKALLPPNSYIHNKMEKTITLNKGGVILYTGCEDIMSVRSINAGDVFIDEASQLDEEEYMELLWRLRVDSGGGKLYCCTNPANQGHWLYRRYLVDNNKDRRLIRSNSIDNIFLPKEQREWMNSLTEEEKERYTSAEWLSTEAMIYKNWSRSKHIKKLNIEKLCDNIIRWCISLDYGYKHPTAMMLCGLGADGTMYVFEEWCESGKIHKDILEQISIYMELLAQSTEEEPTIVIDPSAALFCAECIAQGWNAIKADNKVDIGIDRIRNKLSSNKLLINDSCDTLPKEFECYSYGDDKKPVKVMDDCLDSIRYAAGYFADISADEAVEEKKSLGVYVF